MIKGFLILTVIFGIACGLSYAIGGRSRDLFGYPLLWLTAGYSFLVQVIAFIPAFIFNTEMFFDLTGSITFITISILTLAFNENPSLRQYISSAIVMVWAGRLGLFLFSRILSRGEDSRFIEIKKSTFRFFRVWLIQGLWVFITMSPLLVIMTAPSTITVSESLRLTEIFGIFVWFVGFAVEVIADSQKSNFNSREENKGHFINQGLWTFSRHPNYVGEILIWTGAAIFAFANLKGGELLGLISPFFVYLLLLKVSGVPMLEAKADKKWGNDKAYL